MFLGSNPISDVWAREAMRIMRDYFRRAVNDPNDDEVRAREGGGAGEVGVL